MRNIVAIAAVAAAFMASPAIADTVPGVYSTGVGTDGTVLPAGSADPHYNVSPPSGGTAAGVVTSQNGAWMTPDAGSAYLGDSNTGAAGIYNVLTTFDLTGFDPSTASLSGLISADNSADIYLNGHLIGSVNGFSSLQSFGTSNSSFFTAGSNSLLFNVTNAGDSPSPWGIDVGGLSVTASRLSDVAAVPEPATWAMMLLGFAAIGVASRRKRTAALRTA